MPDILSYSLSYGDYSREKSTTQLNIEKVDSILAARTAMLPLINAIGAVTDGVLMNSFLTDAAPVVTDFPSDAHAQRESKWLVTYRDVTNQFTEGAETFLNPNYGKLYKAEIPCATLTAALVNRKDDWTYDDATSLPAEWHTFKTQWESLVKSPSGGAVEVLNVHFVGRNT